MGKYMKNSQHTLLVSGVRTRAKALSRLQLEPHLDPASFCYLQLRSRRLHKLPLPPPSTRRQQTSRVRATLQGDDQDEASCPIKNEGGGRERGDGALVEASFGENDPDAEDIRGRSTRESTPCSLIRDPSSIATPGSTTRRAPASRGAQSVLLRKIPAIQEMEEFFALAEQQQHKLFLNKYNFDIVNDTPIPGRFDWVRVV